MRLWLGLAVSLLFLVLLAWQFDLSNSMSQLRHANPAWLLPGLAALAADFSLRVGRWRLLLEHFNPAVRWRDAAGPFLGSFALNNVVPLRAGDVARAFAFSRELGVESGYVTSTLLVERVLDLAALLFILLLSLVLLPADADLAWVNLGTYALLASLLVAVLLVLATPHWWKRLVELSGIQDSAPGRFAIQVFAGLEEFRGWSLWLKLISWSLLCWILEGIVFLACCLALSITPYWVAPWFAMSVGSLGTLLPSSPGYVGTFDCFAALAFASSGTEDAMASSAAILVHLLLWIPVTLVGGGWLLRHWGSALGSRVRSLRDRAT